MRLPQVCLGLLVGLLTVQALPSPDPPRSNSFLPFHSSALFSVDPLTSVRRSFQDIQAGVGRSMRSLMAAGSAIGHRMLGMITRAPRLLSHAPLLFSSGQATHQVEPTAAPSNHHPSPPVVAKPPFPDFDDCDCHFGDGDLPPPKFHPISDNAVGDSYGSPVATPLGLPSSGDHTQISASSITSSPPVPVSLAPLPQNTVAPLDNSIHDLSIPDVTHEPVIHPGGGDAVEHLDVHKVEVLGAASVVQAPSAKVPDQEHPEKYMNFDTAWLDTVVHHNLWYKDTKAFKHHKHGEKKKVIPHLHPHHPA